MKISVTVEVPDGAHCDGCRFNYGLACEIFNSLVECDTEKCGGGGVDYYYTKLAACRAAEIAPSNMIKLDRISKEAAESLTGAAIKKQVDAKE